MAWRGFSGIAWCQAHVSTMFSELTEGAIDSKDIYALGGAYLAANPTGEEAPVAQALMNFANEEKEHTEGECWRLLATQYDALATGELAHSIKQCFEAAWPAIFNFTPAAIVSSFPVAWTASAMKGKISDAMHTHAGKLELAELKQRSERMKVVEKHLYPEDVPTP